MKTNQTQTAEKTDLSRRALLAWLPILGVGGAAAMTLGVREADATPVTDAAAKAKDLADDKVAEGKKADSSTASIRTTYWTFLLKRAGRSVGGRAGRCAGCAAACRRVRRRQTGSKCLGAEPDRLKARRPVLHASAYAPTVRTPRVA